ncbi:GDP-L-fucose synthase [Metapseudomonas otitidis]|uniref:GDP-L-fucose synthase n=1 Tax=Metapseudomonas otitidis TaxID=319939 RepID=UPI00209B478D|nr:GDP-L-fucose synthase [Pseudomonas otitidis]MCO7557855.1 GDP-L-fucose synthase [Pseudomonas otitidis]
MPDKDSRIFVCGHMGMVGSAIVRKLKSEGHSNIITRTRDELDLCDQSSVKKFFSENKIDQVYLAAAKVGGILANNSYPADFLYENLIIQANVIEAAHSTGVQRLLFLGSSCIYPKFSDQPIKESALLSGALEPTNEAYAIAKISGIKLCEGYNRQHGRDYRSVMPTNLYGPGDNFHPDNSHVIPGMMRRFHEAVREQQPQVAIWGTGTPRREFLHVNDMASACYFIMNASPELYALHTSARMSHINVGTGVDHSIRELAELLAKITGFQGELVFDSSKPDGTPRKLLDVSVLGALGWKASVELERGLSDTYQWFLASADRLRN